MLGCRDGRALEECGEMLEAELQRHVADVPGSLLRLEADGAPQLRERRAPLRPPAHDLEATSRTHHRQVVADQPESEIVRDQIRSRAGASADPRARIPPNRCSARSGACLDRAQAARAVAPSRLPRSHHRGRRGRPRSASACARAAAARRCSPQPTASCAPSSGRPSRDRHRTGAWTARAVVHVRPPPACPRIRAEAVAGSPLAVLFPQVLPARPAPRSTARTGPDRPEADTHPCPRLR